MVATTPQVADLVANVGGERIALAGILEPGSDPHEFEPRPGHVAATAEADLVFAAGRDLDPWAATLLEQSGSEATLVDLSDSLPAGASDPHWWHDPRNAVAAVDAIADRLAEVDPAGAPTYARNARDYGGRIRRLDREIRVCIARIPPARRKLVTDHESITPFAERYGLRVVGSILPAATTHAQPSARDLSRLAAAIEREGVPAIFTEGSFDLKPAEAIAAQTGVDLEAGLYGDTLGASDSGAASYLEMMASNARTIAAGLSAGEVDCEFDTGK